METKPSDQGSGSVPGMGIEFTGERFVPDIGLDAEIEIEHRQRYLSIKDLVKGKKVLDAASGAGYGTSLLAQSAAYVCGLEIDQEAVTFSRKQYRQANLDFLRGSVACLPLADHSVDVIVSFETIEHIDEALQKFFLGEIKRVLKADGLLIISSPEKKTYSDLLGYRNIYHTKEFYQDEFETFLKGVFPHVLFYRQFLSLAYVLQGPSTAKFSELAIREGENPPKYLVAICGNQPIPECAIDSIELDKADQYQRKINRIIDLQEENTEKNRVIDRAYDIVRERDGAIDELNRSIGALSDELNQKNEKLKDQEAHAHWFQEQGDLDRQALATREETVARLTAELNGIRGTRGWRLLQMLYRAKSTIFGR